jgi:hypothetical protein
VTKASKKLILISLFLSISFVVGILICHSFNVFGGGTVTFGQRDESARFNVASKVKLKSSSFSRDRSSREVIVRFRTQNKLSKSFFVDLKPIRVEWLEKLHVYKLTFPNSLLSRKAVDRLRKFKTVKYAELVHNNWKLLTSPNDPKYTEQWNLQAMLLPAAWDIIRGSQRADIAVIDSGVDYEHEDLYSKVSSLSYDAINNNHQPIDDLDADGDGVVEGHGTQVAGVAAAMTDNSLGIAGAAWDSGILAVKVFNSEGATQDWIIGDGITYAANNGARILNLSFGSRTYSSGIEEWITETRYQKDVIFVAAAGQVGTEERTEPVYPANIPNVIGVGAIDNAGQLHSSSKIGKFIDLVAPGVSIWATAPNNRYVQEQGTSVAAAQVSAVASLVATKFPNKSNDEVERVLKETADDLGQPGRDDYYGYGLVNPYRALSTQIDHADDTESVSYTGNWRTPETGAAYYAYKDSFHESNQAGNTATFTFNGTGIFWVTRIGPDQGKARVWLDGEDKGVIDLYKPDYPAGVPYEWQYIAFMETGLTDGQHTITIEVLGEKNPASSDSWVSIDGFDFITSDTTPPSPPSNITATAGNQEITVEWDVPPEPDVAGYLVYWGTESSSYLWNETVPGRFSTSYKISGLTNGTRYYIAVSAFDSSGNESTKSIEVSAVPSAPPGGGGGDGGGGTPPGGTPPDTTPPAIPSALQAQAGDGQVLLSWRANTEEDLLGYNLYRGLTSDASKAEKITTSVITQTEYLDQGLENGKTYYYFITAVDQAGNESEKSEPVSATPQAQEPTVSFSDLTPDHWAYSYVESLVEKGVINGYPDGTFKPQKTVTRAEFAKMIVLARGWPLLSISQTSFSDVSTDYWGHQYIETARFYRAIKGYPDGSFRPGAKIKRSEIATIIVRAGEFEINISGSKFSDLPSSHWAYNYILTARNQQIVSGYPDGTFRPEGYATRAEAATMIERMLNVIALLKK